MSTFHTNLRQSWVVNRLRVAAWYYRRRFRFFGGATTVCCARIKPPFAPRSFDVPIEEREDAFQVLNTFRNRNAWNKLSFTEEPGVIVDLGANRGYSALYWRSRFPSAQVHGVEMHEGNVSRCRQLFTENGVAGEFHQLAIGDQDGVVRFRPHAAHTRHRLEGLISEDEQTYAYANSAVEVPCLTLASFIRRAGIDAVDILKVDIEGAEQCLLETVGSWSRHVKLVLLEIHHNIDQDGARRRLADAGFEIDLGDALNRTEWWCRRRT